MRDEHLERLAMMASGDPTWDLSDNDIAAIKYALKLIEDQRSTLAHYKWRPIYEIHEDYGPCVLMNLSDPGGLEIGSNLNTDWDESRWTHFAEVPKLTIAEAKELGNAAGSRTE